MMSAKEVRAMTIYNRIQECLDNLPSEGISLGVCIGEVQSYTCLLEDPGFRKLCDQVTHYLSVVAPELTVTTVTPYLIVLGMRMGLQAVGVKGKL